jgi:hypothetical protein
MWPLDSNETCLFILFILCFPLYIWWTTPDRETKKRNDEIMKKYQEDIKKDEDL